MSTILWIVLLIVALTITLMLTLWSREEPIPERRPMVGDEIIIIKCRKAAYNNWQVTVGIDEGGYYIKDRIGSIEWWGIIGPLTYRLQSDGKLYRW